MPKKIKRKKAPKTVLQEYMDTHFDELKGKKGIKIMLPGINYLGCGRLLCSPKLLEELTKKAKKWKKEKDKEEKEKKGD